MEGAGKLIEDDELMVLTKAIDPGPNGTPAQLTMHQLRLGQALRNIGKLDEAIPHLQKAVELSPDGFPLPHTQLAQIHAMKKQWDPCIIQARKALIGNASDMTALSLLSHALGEAGRWKEEAKVSEQTFEIEKLYRMPLH